ncbi:ISAs1 family transposase [Streptomyces sp. NBC_00289]|uniref:ISAs1 family transposase n=1 Tax=Streptomyces sp. NBC_00289 TaxID=2975703 RepID=UPI00324FFB97
MLVVKRNQPALWEACRSIPWSEVTARHKESEVGHGRLETRVVQAVTWTSLVFPHVKQVARVTRHRADRATGTRTRTRETVYLITDLSASEAAPDMLGRYARGHWGVENKIHYVRDVTFGEDPSRIRSGHGPQNASTLRSVAMNYLRTMGTSIADAKRQIALSPHKAPLDLFGLPTDLRPANPDPPPKTKKIFARQLVDRLSRRREDILRSLHDLTALHQQPGRTGHPHDQNPDEALRGWRTPDSANRWLLVRSSPSTARKQGLNPMNVLRDLFAGNVWLPPAHAQSST